MPWTEKKRCEVLGRTMAYVETGEGAPIVLLHGNPTSSYLWRRVIPHLSLAWPLHRARPDRHGRFGQTGGQRPGHSYRFIEHRRYLDALLEALGPRRARHLHHARLGLGPGLRLGQPAPGGRPWTGLHGGHRAAVDVGAMARGGATGLSGVSLGERRVHGFGEERVRRARAAGLDQARS